MRAESNLGGLLGKASRLLSNRFNQDLTTYGLTIEQWSLLAVLWSEDAQNQTSLQQELLKDKATITSLVGYLVKNGFVFKDRDETDKRAFIISLTDKGREMQGSTIPLAMKNIGFAIEGIDAEALKTTVKVLTQIIENFTKE